jgi:hypothetical protein
MIVLDISGTFLKANRPFIVAVSNLLFHGFPIRNGSLPRLRAVKTIGGLLCGLLLCVAIHRNLEAADLKSATQQAGSPRYEQVLPHSTGPVFHAGALLEEMLKVRQI